MAGEVYLRKTVHMAVDQMILSTPHGTVLGAYAVRRGEAGGLKTGKWD